MNLMEKILGLFIYMNWKTNPQFVKRISKIKKTSIHRKMDIYIIHAVRSQKIRHSELIEIII